MCVRVNVTLIPDQYSPHARTHARIQIIIQRTGTHMQMYAEKYRETRERHVHTRARPSSARANSWSDNSTRTRARVKLHHQEGEQKRAHTHTHTILCCFCDRQVRNVLRPTTMIGSCVEICAACQNRANSCSTARSLACL